MGDCEKPLLGLVLAYLWIYMCTDSWHDTLQSTTCPVAHTNTNLHSMECVTNFVLLLFCIWPYICFSRIFLEKVIQEFQ